MPREVSPVWFDPAGGDPFAHIRYEAPPDTPLMYRARGIIFGERLTDIYDPTGTHVIGHGCSHLIAGDWSDAGPVEWDVEPRGPGGDL